MPRQTEPNANNAFQIEPRFSDPDDLGNAAGSLMPNYLPDIVPITAEDFQD